ncbi:PREDICTED: cytoplasmic dynein 1 light intermediate chain 2-like [Priapulus caudatus]|uniref:Dynein light intermediate chain n=1 Tax=Priapulus caudatus TaxID=37621 RepID=A0ABM1EGV1_PRICU|nr:PREDICTED: cytoplasmic dynein 1 light intermediate chain 2-like [Priapulus caudatus]
MAPIGERSAKLRSDLAPQKETEQETNLWSEILSDVQTSDRTKLPAGKSIVVIGDNEAGKTTLVAKLQGVEDPKRGAGLEYHYVDVQDEYGEDQSRLGVWTLDGDPHHTNLMKYVLTRRGFADTAVLLIASMATPWSIVDSLRSWTTILQDAVDRLRVAPDDMRQHQDRIVEQFQRYVEPEESAEDAMTTSRRSVGPLLSPDEGDVTLPLGEGVLVHNLGLPIIVVITKCDYVSNLEKEYDYRDEHLDFIQQHIRKFCLSFGASLFYTSIKDDKNCDLLYKYIMHRLYRLPFNIPAHVVEKDSIFIPSGWDNEKKISILFDNMNSMKPDDSYTSVISKPSMRRPVNREMEVAAEEEQMFLMKLQTQLNTQAPAGGRQESPVSVQKDRRVSGSPGMPSGSPKIDAGKVPAGPGSEGVLANFFNSLLSKKTGSPGSPGSTPKTEKGTRSDVAAELDRMTRGQKSPSINNLPSPSQENDRP